MTLAGEVELAPDGDVPADEADYDAESDEDVGCDVPAAAPADDVPPNPAPQAIDGPGAGGAAPADQADEAGSGADDDDHDSVQRMRLDVPPTSEQIAEALNELPRTAPVPAPPPFVVPLALPPGTLLAEVVRKTGRDTYVVQLAGSPGFHEIQCYSQQILDTRRHDLDNADAFTFSQGVCPVISVSLGPFCLKKLMFLNCAMQCPPNYVVRGEGKRAGSAAPQLEGLKRRKWGGVGA